LAPQVRTRTEFALNVSHATKHGSELRQLTITVDSRDLYPEAENTTSIWPSPILFTAEIPTPPLFNVAVLEFQSTIPCASTLPAADALADSAAPSNMSALPRRTQFIITPILLAPWREARAERARYT
jgi:hypothetical protein